MIRFQGNQRKFIITASDLVFFQLTGGYLDDLLQFRYNKTALVANCPVPPRDTPWHPVAPRGTPRAPRGTPRDPRETPV